MGNILVNWDAPRPFTIHLPAEGFDQVLKDQAERKKKEGKEKSDDLDKIIKQTQTIRLFPGNNVVDESLWKIAMQNPIVRQYLEKGTLSVVQPKIKGAKDTKSDKKEKSLDTLSGIDVKEAVGIAKETYNLDLLKKWADGEKRRGVRKILEKQIKAIEIPKKPKARKEDEDD